MVGHISLVFELVFPESVRIVKEQGYLEKLLHFESRNAVTNAQFAELRAEMERYLKGKVMPAPRFGKMSAAAQSAAKSSRSRVFNPRRTLGRDVSRVW